MSKIRKSFSFSGLSGANPELLRALDDMYDQLVDALNTKATVVESTSSPPASGDFNKEFEIGDIFVKTDTDSPSMLTSRTSDIAVTWTGI